LKILFILGFPNPFPGAAWTRIGFFANAWSKRGHSIETLGTFSYKSFPKRGIRKSGKVNIFNTIFNICLNHPLVFALNSIISFMASTLFLIARKPNVVIVSVPTGDIGLGAMMACKLVRAKYVVDYRDEWEDYAISLASSEIGKFSYSMAKKLSASLYAKSQLVAAVTPKYMVSLKRRGVANLRLIPNGADAQVFKPLSIRKENESFTIFYSGHVGGYYRLDIVVKSIKKLIDKNLNGIKLVIAGTGEIEKVLNLALELGISSNIEYRGAINDKAKLAHLIAEADVGLIPYDDKPLWKNSLPAKFFEYCACAVPVIATVYQDSVLAELINTHQVGLTVPPLDEDRLTKTLEELYYNPEFVIATSKRARLLVEKSFDRAKIAEDLLNLLKQLVET
jgi:glycosyltransferase involved in cell wall biosynthesis